MYCKSIEIALMLYVPGSISQLHREWKIAFLRQPDGSTTMMAAAG